MLVAIHLIDQKGNETTFANVQNDSIHIEQQGFGTVLVSFQINNQSFVEAGVFSVIVSVA